MCRGIGGGEHWLDRGAGLDVLLLALDGAGGDEDAAVPASRGAASLLLFALASVLGDAAEPVEKDGGRDVEDDVRPDDAPVAPLVLRVRADGRQERVGLADLAVRTVVRRVAVQHVPACRVDVRCQVVRAGLSGFRRVEVQILVVGTCHGRPGHGHRKHPVDQVGEGTHSVHEALEKC